MKLRFSKKKFKDETDYLYIRMVPLIFSTVPLAARDRPARVRGVMGLGVWLIQDWVGMRESSIPASMEYSAK